MEAIRRQTVQEAVDRLRAQFPESKYILLGSWPGGDIEMPRDVDLVVNTVPIPLEGLTGDPAQNGYLYEISSGRLAPMKPLLMQIADAGGIDWKPSQAVRDAGDDPSDARTWAVAGLIRELSGDRLIMATKRIDFQFERDRDEAKWRMKPDTWRVWVGGKQVTLGSLSDADYETFIKRSVDEADLQRRGTSNEMGETKAKERLIREAFALPQTYTKAQLQGKQFAVLRVIYAPRPETEAERARLMEITAARFFPAFGLPAPVQTQPSRAIEGPKETPRQIEGSREVVVTLVDDDEDSEPATQQQNAGGNAPVVGDPRQVSHTETPPASVSQQPAQQPSPDGGEQVAQPLPLPLDAPASSGSSKPAITAEKITFLQAVKIEKDKLFALLGDEEGAKEYYKLLLATSAVQHSNEIPEGEKQGLFYRKLKRMVQLLGENKAAGKKPEEPSDPLAPFIEQRRRSLGRMADDRIQRELDDILEDYPTGTDPLKIMPRISTAKGREQLIEITMEIIKWQMDEPARLREAQKGGAKR